MPQHTTTKGLNRMVTTTLSDADREELERLRLALGWSVSGFVKRAIKVLISEQRTNEVVLAVEQMRKEKKR